MTMIIQSFKVNWLPVQNESGGHIWDGLLYFWIKSCYQELKTCKTETSENSRP